MPFRFRTAARIEALETRCLLSSSYVVYGVSDFTPSQPFMHYYFTRTPGGNPIAIDDGTGTGTTTFEDFSIPAYLDTGTSGMILDQASVQDLGIQNESFNGSPVVFNDIGIGGGQSFTVSEPLYVGLAPNDPTVDVNDQATWQSVYTQTYGTASSPIRLENNPNTTYDPNNFFAEPTNILGMPFMMGKYVVMNPTPVYSTTDFGDMNTYIYNWTPNPTFTGATGNPGVPPTSLHVQLSYANFLPYTTQYPPDAPGPTFAPNPFIGPNPIHQIDPTVPAGNVPPVSVNFGASKTTGSFLFDTGAQISFISQAMAAQLGVHYDPTTVGTTDPVLVDNNGNKIPNQSPLQIEGTDGNAITATEFYLDSLTVQTKEGTPITFTEVPVLVQDVKIQDPNTGNILTLDGDFGANMLFGSDATGQNAAFNWVTFDQPDGLLGFAPAAQVGASAAVVGHYIFYNNSTFDGNNPTTNAADDNAIATDKRVLVLGDGLATPANYTSYSKGINGIMIDVTNLPATTSLNASDFTFTEGNTNTPSQWTAAPAPTAIAVRPGAGVNGSTRIELTWADGAIRNQWLQVTMLADANTGLPITDQFYVGNLVGSSGQPAVSGSFSVSSTDLTAARNDPHNFLNPAPVSNLHDYNRDGRVDALDQLIARAESGVSILDFNSPVPPSTGGTGGGTGFGTVGSSGNPAKLLTSAFHPIGPAVTAPTPKPVRHAAIRHSKAAPLLHTTVSWENERRILLMSWRSEFRKWSRVIIRPAVRRIG